MGKKIRLPESGEIRPFVFGTDTTFGLKAAWSGLTAQFPDTIKLGYHRKEMAWAPVFLKEESCTIPVPPTTKSAAAPAPNAEEAPQPGQHTAGKFKVNVPSFLATIDLETSIKGDPQSDDSGNVHVQYFATGIAATNLALKKEIRQTMLKRIDPKAAAENFTSGGKHIACLEAWRDSDRENNTRRLREWMKNENISLDITDFLYGAESEAMRAAVIRDLQITCS